MTRGLARTARGRTQSGSRRGPRSGPTDTRKSPSSATEASPPTRRDRPGSGNLWAKARNTPRARRLPRAARARRTAEAAARRYRHAGARAGEQQGVEISPDECGGEGRYAQDLRELCLEEARRAKTARARLLEACDPKRSWQKAE